MRKIKIVHVLNILDLAGTETMIMNMYNNINREKFEFVFIVHGDDKGYYEKQIEDNKGIIYRVPRFKGINIIEYINSFNEIYDEVLPDIVHGHLGSTASIYLSIAKKKKIKTIAHSHNTYKKQVSIKQTLYKIISYPTRFIADNFFACSRKAGADRFGKGVIKNDSFFIIPNSLNPEKFKFNIEYRDTIRKKYNLNPEKIVIGHIGRFSNQKNHKKIIDVFIELLTINNQYHLLLIGDGDKKDEVIKKIKENKITDKVTILPSQEEVWKFYNAFDLFLFPSLYEGFGMVLIEAQYNGLTCIVSEAIVKEVYVTDNIQKIDLKNKDKHWASVIDVVNKKRPKPLNINNEKYNIEHSIKDIENIYRRIYFNE